MRCPNCGTEITDYRPKQVEEKASMQDWIVTETGLLKLLAEAEKALEYREYLGLDYNDEL